MENEDKLEELLEKALTDLHGGTLGDLVRGVEEMGNVMWNIPDDLSGCSGGTIKEDMSVINKWTESFINPVHLVFSLEKNIAANYQDIMDTMGRFQDDYTKGDMFNAGNDISQVMSDALGKPSGHEDTKFKDTLKAWTHKLDKVLGGLY